MNVVTINGYTKDKGKYSLNDGVSEYLFIVNVVSPNKRTISPIPVKIEGHLADECQLKLNANDYVEITGELERDGNKVYVLGFNMVHRASKDRTTYVMRSTQFLQTYAPAEIMERIEKQLEKMAKRERERNNEE